MPLQDRSAVFFFLLAASACAQAPPLHFCIIGSDAAGWPQVLSSVGFSRQDSDLAKIFVLRPATPASRHWADRVEHGAYLILEGESPIAESFGFKGGKQRVPVGSIVDARRPKLPIIWKNTLEIPRFAISKDATVFAKERWTGAPVLAGYRRGAGAVLWVAASPGEQGYERFPYLLQALADLGLETPFRSAPPVGVLRLLLSHARRPGLLRRPLARRRHRRAARGRLALL